MIKRNNQRLIYIAEIDFKYTAISVTANKIKGWEPMHNTQFTALKKH